MSRYRENIQANKPITKEKDRIDREKEQLAQVQRESNQIEKEYIVKEQRERMNRQSKNRKRKNRQRMEQKCEGVENFIFVRLLKRFIINDSFLSEILFYTHKRVLRRFFAIASVSLIIDESSVVVFHFNRSSSYNLILP